MEDVKEQKDTEKGPGCDPKCEGNKDHAKTHRGRRPPRYVKVQETKKTDWKYEFILEPSRSCLMICGLCLLLTLPAVIGTVFTMTLPEDRAVIVVTPTTSTTTTGCAPPEDDDEEEEETNPPTTTTTTTTAPQKSSLRYQTGPEILPVTSRDGPDGSNRPDGSGDSIRTTKTPKPKQDCKVGVGIGDMTGPVVQVPFMINLKRGQGIHTRQFARAFNFVQGATRVVFVVAEAYAIGSTLRREVVTALRKLYGQEYTLRNVFIAATSAYCTPGGHMVELLLDNGMGYSKETNDAYVKGIVESIKNAHCSVEPAKLFYSKSSVPNVQLNRSPKTYTYNPKNERQRFSQNFDDSLVQLRIERNDSTQSIMGVVNWFAVHAGSMNMTNNLVSSDNFGRAAYLLEKHLNRGKIAGKAKVVTAFAPSNLGDIIPITTPMNKSEKSNHTFFENTKIVGRALYKGALRALKIRDTELKKDIAAVHQFVNFQETIVSYTKKKISGCVPSFGEGYGSGTQLEFKFKSLFSNTIRGDFKMRFKPPGWDSNNECQNPKTDGVQFSRQGVIPFSFYPKTISMGVLNLGGLVVACIPGEPTTMAGRRIQEAVEKVMRESSVKGKAIVSASVNDYIYYVTTPEEYNVQNYEGKLTIYGPKTLEIIITKIGFFTSELLKGTLKVTPGQVPEDYRSQAESTVPMVGNDTTPPHWNFGDVLLQPPDTVAAGTVVKATFIAANPRNDRRQESSYLIVETQNKIGQWLTIARDAEWETKFIWHYTYGRVGSSRAVLEWDIPKKITPAVYRMRYFGTANVATGVTKDFEGVTNGFNVVKPSSDS